MILDPTASHMGHDSLPACGAGCFEPSLEKTSDQECVRAGGQQRAGMGSALPLGLQSGGLHPKLPLQVGTSPGTRRLGHECIYTCTDISGGCENDKPISHQAL